MTDAGPQSEFAGHKVLARAVTAGVIAAFACAQLARSGTPSSFEYDQGVYLCSARALAHGRALFTQIFSSQPPAFLESLAIALRIGGDSVATGHVFILFFAVLALLACADLARRIGGPWAAAATTAALAFAHTFIELGHHVQAEMPALAVGLCSLCCCLHARARGWRRRWIVLGGALLALAALFKLFVVPLVVPALALLLLREQSDPDRAWELDRSSDGPLSRIFVFCAAGAVITLLPLALYDTRAMLDQTLGLHLAKQTAFPRNLGTNATLLGRELLSVFGVTVLAVAGLCRLGRTNPVAALWLGSWTAAAVAAVLAQSPLFWRHPSLVLPPLAIAAGTGALLFLRAGGRARMPAAAACSLLLGAGFTDRGVASLSYIKESRLILASPRPDGEFERIVAWIRSNTKPRELIAGDDPLAVFVAGRRSPPAICDTSVARIRAGYLSLRQASRASRSASVIILKRNDRLALLRGYRAWVEESHEPVEWIKGRTATLRTVWADKGRRATDARRSADRTTRRSRVLRWRSSDTIASR